MKIYIYLTYAYITNSSLVVISFEKSMQIPPPPPRFKKNGYVPDIHVLMLCILLYNPYIYTAGCSNLKLEAFMHNMT